MDNIAEHKIRHLIEAFIAKGSRSEDAAFDLQTDVVYAVRDAEYPMVDFSDEIGENLEMAVEEHVGAALDKIRFKQTEERTAKIAKRALKRARAVLDRLKPTKEQD